MPIARAREQTLTCDATVRRLPTNNLDIRPSERSGWRQSRSRGLDAHGVVLAAVEELSRPDSGVPGVIFVLGAEPALATHAFANGFKTEEAV